MQATSEQCLPLELFSEPKSLMNFSQTARINTAMVVVKDWIQREGLPENMDVRYVLDFLIQKIDENLSCDLDAILHHPDFQALEATWRSLAYLVEQQDRGDNTKIEILNTNVENIHQDSQDQLDKTQTGLYQQLYQQEYDMPGGEPFAAMIGLFELDSSPRHIEVLTHLANISAQTHCPFIGNAGAQFFHKTDFANVSEIKDFNSYFDRAEFTQWNSFRQTDNARYVGLTLPKFLLRLPHDHKQCQPGFIYHEDVTHSVNHYLWGYSSCAFAANLIRSFQAHGWCVNIRGPESGGRVDNLPLHHFDLGRGIETKLPTEILIPESRELALANLGFIPLSYYKNSDHACFFSANSCQLPALYPTPEATANSRINSRLPYVFLSARIAHYLKVLQRERIGTQKSRQELEAELNHWLTTLVTKMNNPSPELAASHPLREGKVIVEPLPDSPGLYQVSLQAVPHFQVEGMDIRLALVGEMPGSEH